MNVEIRDVVPGLWLWRGPHWEWRPGVDWEPEVASFVVESRGEVLLLDPLAPHPVPGRAVFERLAASPPTGIVVLKPDHVRDVDRFARWYDIPAWGPDLFWKEDTPQVDIRPVRPNTELPGGLRALYDGRGRMETPVYLPEQRALVFADGLAAMGGELRVWWSEVLHEATLPALRAMLELPFEWVLVSHGEPVHPRGEFEAALERAPWSSPSTFGQASDD